MKSGIYIITCLIDNKHYIGRAKNWKDRLVTHKGFLIRNKHPNQHLQNAFNKYGVENFIFDILEEYDINLLPSMEHYWCNLLSVHNRNFGFNIEPTSPYGRIGHSQETKDKISIFQQKQCKKETYINSFYNKKHTKESRDKISNSLKGRVVSKESIQKGQETKKKNTTERGYYHSEETKLNMSLASKDVPKSKEHINAMIKASTRKKPIIMYDKDYAYIKEFDSLSDARRELNCAVNLIYMALNNPNRSAKCFKFKYKQL